MSTQSPFNRQGNGYSESSRLRKGHSWDGTQGQSWDEAQGPLPQSKHLEQLLWSLLCPSQVSPRS